MQVLFDTSWHLSKGKIKSHLAKTLSQWPMQTKIINEIITGDETWCFAYDPETKRQSSEWVGEKSPRPKELKFQRSRIKIMLIIFFDSRGVVNKEFVPKGKRVNAEFYKGIMDRLMKRIQRVLPAAFCCRDFFLLHDNGSAHKAASVCQFLTPEKVKHFITPRTFQIYFRQTIFCSPSWKWS